jgi:hypothetical protein
MNFGALFVGKTFSSVDLLNGIIIAYNIYGKIKIIKKEVLMKKFLAILAAMTMLSVLSFAQAVLPDIYGTVVLADGSAIPGVLVTLTDSTGVKKTAVSSEEGNYRFIRLNPGDYELKVELEGFKTIIRKGIKLTLGKNVTLTTVMETSQIKEEIVVTARTGVIDTRKTLVGTNVTKEQLQSLPTARNPWVVFNMLPGVMVDRIDVGGADSGSQSNFYAAGGSTDDTTWNIDGANVTDPAAVGSSPSYFNSNNYEEMQVITGANDLTAQTGGIQVNFVSKRAGNKVTGDFHLYVEDKAWEMKQDRTDYMISQGYVVPGVNRLYQYGINLGGPIVADKFFWFGSYAIQDIHKRTVVPLCEDATWLISGMFKANFQLGNTTGQFSLANDTKLKWGRPALSAAQQDTGSLWDQVGPGWTYYGGLSQTLGNLLLEAKVVYGDGGFTLDPRGSNIVNGFETGADAKFIVSPSLRLEGSYETYITNRNTINLNANGNYFLEGKLGGDHEIRFGVDYYTGTTTTQSLYPQQRVLYIYRDDPSANYIKPTPNRNLDVTFKRISGYVGDTINFGKLTVGLGLRYDRESGVVNPNQSPNFFWVEPGSPHDGELLWNDLLWKITSPEVKVPAAWATISPRVSFTYDITGDGKNVLKLSGGIYGSQSGNNLTAIYVPYRYIYVAWNDANADEIPTYDELGAEFFHAPVDIVDPAIGLIRTKFADDYSSPKLNELTLSFEKALTSDVGISLTGFYRKRTNLAQDINSRNELVQTSKGFFVGPNGEITIETQANYEQQTRMIEGHAVTVYSRIQNPDGNYFFNYKDSYYQYMAGQFEITKRMGDSKWMANLSATYQDNKRHWAKSDLVDLTNYDFFNEGQVAPSSQGSGLRDWWINSRWIVKLTGMVQLPLGINLSTVLQLREGYPWAPRRTFYNFGQGKVYVYLDNEKIGDRRLPNLFMMNLGLEKTLKVSDSASASLVVDWYNVTNSQLVQKVNMTTGAAAPGATTGSGQEWMNGGVFQFGVRVNF